MTKAKDIAYSKVEEIISSVLTAQFIDHIEYGITYWKIRFSKESIMLNASEIECTSSTLSINNQYEHSLPEVNQAISVGSELLQITNNIPVKHVSVSKQGDLFITFENNFSIKVLAIVEMIDWTWDLTWEISKQQITCDSGTFFMYIPNV